MAEGRMLSTRAPSADIGDDGPCVARHIGQCERASTRERWLRVVGAVLWRSAHPASWPASMAVKSAPRGRDATHAARPGRKAIAVAHTNKEGTRELER